MHSHTPIRSDALGVTNPTNTDCGSSLYTELEIMPDAVCVKAGSIDDKDVRDFKATSVEFYCKDRMGYQTAVEGAEQKPVSLERVIFFCSLFFLGGWRGEGGSVDCFYFGLEERKTRNKGISRFSSPPKWHILIIRFDSIQSTTFPSL